MKQTLLLCAVLAVAGCQRDKGVTEEHPVTLTGGQAPAPRGDDVDRGKYLVTISNCNDCHTPKKDGPNGPELDTSRLLSGHPADMKVLPAPKPVGPWVVAGTGSLTAWSGPWGISYAANLTPDKETGLGSWTEDRFVRAIRTGKHLGEPSGRPILLPMPWFDYAPMTDADLHAIWAYLRSIPPVKNAAPQSEPAAPPPK